MFVYFEKIIIDKKTTISESKSAIKKYSDQQNKVRNNREFTSLNKEVEYLELEMQLAEKRIKEYGFKIESKNEKLTEANANFKQQKKALDFKKKELKELNIWVSQKHKKLRKGYFCRQ